MSLELWLKLFHFDYEEKARKEHQKKIDTFLEKYPNWKWIEKEGVFISPKGERYSLLLFLMDMLEKYAED
jgi:hypothetical protein